MGNKFWIDKKSTSFKQMLKHVLLTFLFISRGVLSLPGVDLPNPNGFNSPVDVPNAPNLQSQLMGEAELRKKLQETLDKAKKEALLKTFEAACVSAGVSEANKACAEVLSKVLDLNKPDVALLASALSMQQINGIAQLASLPKADTGLLLNLIESIKALLFSASPQEKIAAQMSAVAAQKRMIKSMIDSRALPTDMIAEMILTNSILSKVPEIDPTSVLSALSTVQAPEMPAVAALKVRALMGMLPSAPSLPSVQTPGLPTAPSAPGLPSAPSMPNFGVPSVPTFGVPSLPGVPSAPGLPNLAMPGVPQVPNLNAQEALGFAALLQMANGLRNF